MNNIKSTEIKIEGMHCASCQINLTKSLRKVKGVEDVHVNLMLKKAHISYKGELDTEKIKKAVESIGNYKVVSFNAEENHEMNPHEESKGHEHMTHSKHSTENIEEHSHHSGSAEDSEISNWKKRMIRAWIFTIPVALLMFSERLFNLSLFPENITTIILLVLAFPVIFIFGWNTLKGGFKGLLRFYFNMDLLISLGTIIAFSTGILKFILPVKDYSGVSAMIMAIFLTGKFIESRARGRAGQEIKKLLELGAKKAVVLRSGKEIEINISELKVGDILIVKPGEKIPSDGIVVKGESSVDESFISGESIPVDKIIGSKVIGATINQNGILQIKVEKIGKETFLSNIIKLVEQTQNSKIPIQALADKITNIFVPVVLLISVLTFVFWFSFSNNLGISLGIAISVLVIACPCALGLATPTALTVGSGIGAKNGILIRKGEAIQTMKKINTIIFDKTGTITKGKPEVVDIYFKNKKDYLLRIAGSMEKLSEHPLSKAVVNYCKLKKYTGVVGFKILRGFGIEGKMNKKEIIIGNSKLMKQRNINLSGFEEKINEFEGKGYTSVIVSESKKIIGIFGIADSIKEDSREIIKKLNSKGYRTIMITGDNEKTAKTISKQVGIKEVIANILPDEKVHEVKKIQKKEMVAFVGDGVNDAPALKQSNVGIVMSSGSDIAIESGDIVLTKNSLEGVLQAINLSKATFGKIKQNLFWAFAYNTIAIPLAIAGVLSPIIAELAMALSSITVVTNANLLRKKKI